jgi:hypothetical protein
MDSSKENIEKLFKQMAKEDKSGLDSMLSMLQEVEKINPEANQMTLMVEKVKKEIDRVDY